MTKLKPNIFHLLNKNLHYVNDLRDIDSEGVLHKIKDNTNFSVSYIVLLSAATIVCTLGLLLNSAPIVIGGMLISPLMWPLMKISIGVSFERKSFIVQAFYLLLFSILISLACAILVTTIVPLRAVTNEILSRTTPTLLDIFVAIAAGSIAAFSIIQKKISDSLAGVAIATSLMPPLCVSGIGFVLGDYAVAYGGFLLFFTNVISIIFISVFIFSFVGVRRNSEHQLRMKGIIYIIVVLLLTSIPLINSLQNYTFKLKAYQESRDIISNELYAISPELSIENISTAPDPITKDTILVNADIVSPESITLDYTQKEKIVSSLEDKLGKKIVLNLRIQKTISLKSEQDILNGNSKKLINEYVGKKISERKGQIVLGNIESLFKDGKWQVLVVLRAEPNTSFKEAERQLMQDELGGVLQAPVSLSVNLIPLLSLTDDSEEMTDKIKADVEEFIYFNDSAFEVTNLQVLESPANDESGAEVQTKKFSIKIYGTMPDDAEFENLDILKIFLTEKYTSNFQIEITSTPVKKIIMN